MAAIEPIDRVITARKDSTQAEIDKITVASMLVELELSDRWTVCVKSFRPAGHMNWWHAVCVRPVPN